MLTAPGNRDNFFPVKFLKVLLNSLISGFFFSNLLVLLILDLNINIPFRAGLFIKLTIFLFVIYGIITTILCILFFYIFQFFSGRRRNIGLISASFLIVSFSSLIILFLIIFKTNRDFFISFFSPQNLYYLDNQPIFLVLFAVFAVVILYSYHRSKRKLILALFPLLLIITMTATVYQRTLFEEPLTDKKEAILEATQIKKNITIIGLDGLSFDFLIPLINEGKLRNFQLLMEQGSWGRLESFTPNEPLTLINSFNTGKLPYKHRQISLFSYEFLGLKQELQIVPRYLFFRQLTKTPILRVTPRAVPLETKDIWKILQENNTTYLKKDWPFDRTVENPSQKAETTFNRFFEDLKFEENPIFQTAKEAIFTDVDNEDAVTLARSEKQPQILYFHLNGLNIVEAYFYKYNFPEHFGIIDQEEISKFGSVIERYYQFYDQIISKYLASMKMGEEILVVYSPHGIEPLPLWKRFVEWVLNYPGISAYHEQAPEGVVFFYGREIVKGINIEGMKLVDIAPTLLNYLGLPVGKDMDGIVKSSIFSNEYKNPVLYISSYEAYEIRQTRQPSPE